MSDRRARKESARSADFRTKLDQSGATVSVTTEGFDTADLKDAKALLDELA
jgi:hypothetical protein